MLSVPGEWGMTMKKGFLTDKRTAVPADRKPPDYRMYKLSIQDVLQCTGIYALISGAIAFLFFNDIRVWGLLSPGLAVFLRIRRRQLAEARRELLQRQFLTGMQMVCTSLRAGYAIENAFREALHQLEGTYDQDAPIVQEFRMITAQNGLNYPIEKLLLELGQRSGVEDIRSFAEVFSVARRMGGDLIVIIGNTISSIERKSEVQLEIRTVLAGKRMELHIMCGAPLAILGYIRLTSPEFLMPLYGQTLGIAVMSFCLVLYAAAFLWGSKILNIEV